MNQFPNLTKMYKTLMYAHNKMEDQNIPLSFLIALVYIDSLRECSFDDIRKILGCSSSTISRTIQRLSDGKRDGKRTFAGMGLVECKEDPSDMRYNRVRLTPKGQELINNMAMLLK